ncbi:phosphotransferase [Epidermidibacterium keratini]|uniref:Phosphotransferase n=1 Tax=Epidermidibacterium keratini TaxID=1891644 RepID=A0A7L4YHQ3_9ACTN|nr:phosphotransferase family protein [Epidermidibacterium keratini]QHB98861.1 phosphotransferase [Epidermidibacterium keratini]
MTAEDLAPALQRWAEAQYGADVRVDDVTKMPGNAGLSFGFGVDDGSGAARRVIRLAPPGVTKRGNTDVLRQVPLLNVLQRNGIPVAAVEWSSDDPAWFGTDAFVQRFLPGAPLHMGSDAGSVPVGADGVEPFVAHAAQTLARIHAIDWRTELDGWEEPRDLPADVGFWRGLQAKAAEPQMGERAEQLAVALLDSVPAAPPVGIFHGDFHTNNIMYLPDATITGVVDWEISGIGAQPLDIGWLSIFTDPTCWAPDRQAQMRVVVDPQWLLGVYQEAAGRQVSDAAWFKAYACYRFSVIAAFNLRLHRKGYRPDPHYEELAASTYALADKGLELLRDPAQFAV